MDRLDFRVGRKTTLTVRLSGRTASIMNQAVKIKQDTTAYG